MNRQFDGIEDNASDTERDSAAIIPFPAINMVGRHRTTAAVIAALPEDQRLDVFAKQGKEMRETLIKLGVSARAAREQHYDLAYALAAELVRIGVRGRFEPWLKNWRPKGLQRRKRSA